MKNKKKNVIIAIITLIVILIMIFGICIYFGVNYSADENSLTIVEKKWLTDNSNNIVSCNSVSLICITIFSDMLSPI